MSAASRVLSIRSKVGFAVLATGSGLPDIFVALIMAGLGISGGLQVVRHARSEMRTAVA